jgi:hypothetical protein
VVARRKSVWWPRWPDANASAIARSAREPALPLAGSIDGVSFLWRLVKFVQTDVSRDPTISPSRLGEEEAIAVVEMRECKEGG